VRIGDIPHWAGARIGGAALLMKRHQRTNQDANFVSEKNKIIPLQNYLEYDFLFSKHHSSPIKAKVVEKYSI
jgi:hypothetical protein